MWLKNKRRGFSLVEITVVIVIIVIISGAIVAMMGPFSRRQALDTSLVSLLGDLRLVQQFALVRRGGYKYFGIRFYDNLGENSDRQGWKIVVYCTIDPCGVCQVEVPLPITEASSFSVVKSSQSSDLQCGCASCPELLTDNTFFTKGVSIDPTSEFQVNPAPPGQLRSIIFTTEGSATRNGVDLLDNNNDEIKLNIGGKIKTIRIIPLTGHVKIE